MESKTNCPLCDAKGLHIMYAPDNIEHQQCIKC